MTISNVQTIVRNAPEAQENPQEAISRLAALPTITYEQMREAEAKKLGVRVSVLDSEVLGCRRQSVESTGKAEMFPVINLWPEPIDGATLLTEILQTIKTFIVCSPDTATACTLWVALTWVIDHAQVAPLAVITAPEKRCGKSQMLNLIGRLSRRPLVASNISPAAIFRVIEAHAPTLLIDEADTFLRENEEARGIINSGHTRQSAYVIRTVGDDHEPKQFSTWGAKVISGIGHLSETLMDRAVVLELRRRLPHEKVERLRHAEAGLFKCLSSQLARWAEDNGPAIGRARPSLPDELHDRAQDNWEPLLAIADCVGGDWPKLARDAALKISGAEQDITSLSSELLADIQEIFQRENVSRISSRTLLEELIKDEEAPWVAYNRGKPMSPRQLAKRLGEYGIKSGNVRIGVTQAKGYLLSDFTDVFARYLLPSVPPSQTQEDPINTAHSTGTLNDACCRSDSPSVPSNPLEKMAWDIGTDKTRNAEGNIAEVSL